jgi:hypothetical protein
MQLALHVVLEAQELLEALIQQEVSEILEAQDQLELQVLQEQHVQVLEELQDLIQRDL